MARHSLDLCRYFDDRCQRFGRKANCKRVQGDFGKKPIDGNLSIPDSHFGERKFDVLIRGAGACPGGDFVKPVYLLRRRIFDDGNVYHLARLR